MSIEAQGTNGVVIATRNGVPPDASEATPAWASDPPGGTPRIPDPDTAPHPAPNEGAPAPEPQNGEALENEPSKIPPQREAAHPRSHHRRTA